MTVYLCGDPSESLHLPCFPSASCLILVKLWVAALREEVASEPQSSRSVWTLCPGIMVPWTAVSDDVYAGGLCTLSSLRLVKLGNARVNWEWASERCALS